MESKFELFPVAASLLATKVDNLYFFLVAFSGFLALSICFFIVFFAVKYRKGKAVNRKKGVERHTWKIEMTWIVLPLIISMVIFVWATNLFFQLVAPPKEGMEVYVIGKQWMWKFQHPTGISEINEVHVPVGKKVKFIMSSQDVIHGLFFPAFRVKNDVVPGRYTSIWFEANRTGVFPLYCAEYCGTDHSRMTGKVHVLSALEYQEWLDRHKTQALDQVPRPEGRTEGRTLAEQGRELFQKIGCTTCHQEGSAMRAPLLEGIFGKEVTLSDGRTVKADENYIRESILFPRNKIVQGFEPIMPSYQGQLNEEQLISLLEYIKSLQLPQDQESSP